jgi:hypothetical protein
MHCRTNLIFPVHGRLAADELSAVTGTVSESALHIAGVEMNAFCELRDVLV